MSYAPRLQNFCSPLVADVGGAHRALVGARFARQEVVDARVAKQVPTLAVQLRGVHVQVLFVRVVYTYVRTIQTWQQERQQHEDVSSTQTARRTIAAHAGAKPVTITSDRTPYGSPSGGPSIHPSEKCVGPANMSVRNSAY